MSTSFQTEATLETGIDLRHIRRLLGYARPYALALAGCVVLLLLLAALQLAQPYLIKLAIDDVLVPLSRGHTDVSLGPYVGAYAAIVAAMIGIEYAQGLWLRLTGQAIIARVRHDVFAHLQGLDLAFFDRNPVGRLVTRATNDVEALNDMYTGILVNLFKDVFLIIGAAGMMLALSPRLSLIAFVAMPVVVAAALVFQRLSRETLRMNRLYLARVNAMLAENFAGIRTIQAFAREARTLVEFEEINSAYYRSGLANMQLTAVFRPLLDLIASGAVAALLWFGGLATLDGAITVGTLVAFTTYMRRLFDPVNAVAEKANVLQTALAAAERLFELLDTKPAVTDRPDARIPQPAPGVPAVTFENVSFAYTGEHWVLEDVSFTVMPGDTTAFVGHTGAGKSTIMALVTRFYDVQRGRVLVNGLDVREWPQDALRRHVGTVMQDVFMFAGTVAYNVDLGEAAIDRARVESAGRTVGADAFVQALPGGWDAPVAERGVTLSGGQRQLLAFARTLAHNPGILVLDEATASIDTETERALQTAMQDARTKLVVAHRLSTIQHATRIHVMHHGRIREAGTHAELLASDGLYRRLWRLQASERAVDGLQ